MNPFKKDNQTLPVASINSVYVGNNLASALFRPQVIVKEVKKYAEQLDIDKELSDTDTLLAFTTALHHRNKSIRTKAKEIAVSFGQSLAAIILTLKKPSELDKINRKNWTDIHWDYWLKVPSITFVGGLTSPILTQIFLKEIEKVIKKNKLKLDVKFVKGSYDLGTKGLVTKASDGEVLLFDFGQTNIKRAYLIKKESKTKVYQNLSMVESRCLLYKDLDDRELYNEAKILHQYMIDTIKSTIEETDFQGESILLSIANYVQNGIIFKARGGYGKLALLSDNYQLYLSQDLSEIYGREIVVTLYHDTTAMSFAFDSSTKGAIISLGTAFGVAFID